MTRLVRDGVTLGYEEAGRGEPAVVLLHGIACDRRFLAPQLAALSRRRRVVAIDLRGHGESSAPAGSYAIPVLAGDVAWLSEQLGLNRPVVVGHSLGRLVGLELAASRPDGARGVALLDSVPSDRAMRMGTLFSALRSPGYGEVLRKHFAGFFLATDATDQRRWILDAILEAPAHAVISAWEEGTRDWDERDVLARCRVPVLYVDAGTPNADLTALAALCNELTIKHTAGTGHFHQLEAPVQVNRILERFIVRCTDSPAPSNAATVR